ncbi:MAG: Uma2 family endonuclease [Bryobacteraceae bacterium]
MATTTAITGAQFDALPYDEGRRWELIQGELIEVSSPTPEHQILVQRILLALFLYVQAGATGLVLTDVEFALGEDIRVRPDVCAPLGDKAKRLDKSRVPVQSCPDIAIEVLSPSERTSDSMCKVDVYLDHGVREVWQVYPRTRQMMLYTAGQNVRKFLEGATVTTDLLPGFELPLSQLFAESPKPQ